MWSSICRRGIRDWSVDNNYLSYAKFFIAQPQAPLLPAHTSNSPHGYYIVCIYLT